MAWLKKMFGSQPTDPEHSPTSSLKDDDETIKPEDADEVLPENNRSLISQLIAQHGLSVGKDLGNVVLPTFILEPRSLLEKLSDTLVHPQHFTAIPKAASPEERMVAVVKWYFSAYHRRPKGVKKPFNPVLGEFFRANMVSDDGATTVKWTSEQVSHHPPVSAFFAKDEEGTIIMQGHFAPKSRFLGNSAASIGDGAFRILLPEHDEVYVLTWPTVYVRGVIFGTLLMELGGPVMIRCPATGLHADLEFVVKGYFTGTHHQVKGTIFSGSAAHNRKSERKTLYTIDGSWVDQVRIKYVGGPRSNSGDDDTSVAPSSSSSSLPVVLFNYKDEKMGGAVVSGEDEEKEYFSRTMWASTAQAIVKNDQDAATKEKTAVENVQRVLRTERKEKEEVWTPAFFNAAMTADGNAKAQCESQDLEFLGSEGIKFPPMPVL